MAVFEKSSYTCYFIYPVWSKPVNLFYFLFKSSKTHTSAAPLLPKKGAEVKMKLQYLKLLIKVALKQ